MHGSEDDQLDPGGGQAARDDKDAKEEGANEVDEAASEHVGDGAGEKEAGAVGEAVDGLGPEEEV